MDLEKPKGGLRRHTPPPPPSSSLPPPPPRGAAKRKTSSLPSSSSSNSSSSSPNLSAVLQAAAAANAAALVASANNSSSNNSSSSSSSSNSAGVSNQPLNESELQLYRVLQRANLLTYYDTFIAQGGDDVHQLCEAGEEEFLEIMALVGMASKPLHVRRLQKALQEWVQNPGLFSSTPFVPGINSFSSPSAAAAVIRATSAAAVAAAAVQQQQQQQQQHSNSPTPPPALSVPPTTFPVSSSSRNSNRGLSPIHPSPPPPPPPSSSASTTPTLKSAPSSPPPTIPGLATTTTPNKDHPSSSIAASVTSSVIHSSSSPTFSQSSDSNHPPQSTSPLQLTPILTESQIQRISETAELMIKSLPPSFEPKAPTSKKKISKELEVRNYVLSMRDDDPRKMDEIRRFSAIYGRFDCKRKPEKPLTLHEVSVNEAAAQLCVMMPALLTRRDELFPLARQVVRDSGYQYSKGHSRSQFSTGFPSKLFGGCVTSVAKDRANNGTNNTDSSSENNGEDSSSTTTGPSSKRQRLNSETNNDDIKRREKWDKMTNEIRDLGDQLEELRNASNLARESGNHTSTLNINKRIETVVKQQAILVQEQAEYSRYLRSKYGVRGSSDDNENDSQLSYSSSPCSSGPPITTSSHHAGSYVLSASGGQIIAVQNPALNLSAGSLRSGSVEHPSNSDGLGNNNIKQEPSSPPPSISS